MSVEKQIAILGGSFNPITISHIQIAIATIESLLFDEVWISPCYSNPIKNNLISPHHRINMCRIATHKISHKILVSDFEIKNKIADGTYFFLKSLQEEYLENEFSYIIGADQVNILHKWINFEKLIDEFEFVVFNRENQHINFDIPNFYYTLINDTIEPLSSTMFRDNFKKQNYEICKNIVPDKVFNYIVENNLYYSP